MHDVILIHFWLLRGLKTEAMPQKRVCFRSFTEQTLEDTTVMFHAAAEENLYLSVDEISRLCDNANSSVVVNDSFLRKERSCSNDSFLRKERSCSNDSQLQCLATHG